ncbi:hypothetical protein JIN82_14935 [Persicirhabdus sediminis]|uniref:Uncharacterized protein n=2 Tax=Persicirhabdus sediminis TaxID=454144 RepID=A0A8J7MGI6_9BACT|nr:hypothetical protein [Persicirhabdus sediminis]
MAERFQPNHSEPAESHVEAKSVKIKKPEQAIANKQALEQISSFLESNENYSLGYLERSKLRSIISDFNEHELGFVLKEMLPDIKYTHRSRFGTAEELLSALVKINPRSAEEVILSEYRTPVEVLNRLMRSFMITWLTIDHESASERYLDPNGVIYVSRLGNNDFYILSALDYASFTHDREAFLSSLDSLGTNKFKTVTPHEILGASPRMAFILHQLNTQGEDLNSILKIIPNLTLRLDTLQDMVENYSDAHLDTYLETIESADWIKNADKSRLLSALFKKASKCDPNFFIQKAVIEGFSEHYKIEDEWFVDAFIAWEIAPANPKTDEVLKLLSNRLEIDKLIYLKIQNSSLTDGSEEQSMNLNMKWAMKIQEEIYRKHYLNELYIKYSRWLKYNTNNELKPEQWLNSQPADIQNCITK